MKNSKQASERTLEARRKLYDLKQRLRVAQAEYEEARIAFKLKEKTKADADAKAAKQKPGTQVQNSRNWAMTFACATFPDETNSPNNIQELVVFRRHARK